MFRIVLVVSLLLAALSGCVTTESGVMPNSGVKFDIASISGDGITPPATVVCIEKTGCQTGFGQSLATAALQGVVGSAISGGLAFEGAKLVANHATASPIQVTNVKVKVAGAQATALGGSATNLSSSTASAK